MTRSGRSARDFWKIVSECLLYVGIGCRAHNGNAYVTVKYGNFCAFGYLAVRTGSIWYGYILHVTIALFMEMLLVLFA